MQSFKFPAEISPRARVLALSLAAALLGACGGGDGDSGIDNNTATPDTATDFLASGAVASSTGPDKTLLIVNPTLPGQVRLSVSLSATDSYRSNTAYTVDPVTQNVTILGELMVYYIKDRQVFQIDMRKTVDTVSQRISSLDTACTVLWEQPMHFGRADAWIGVSDAGPDNNCATPADNGTAYIRTGTPVGTAATRLPAGVTLVAGGVPTADMASLQYFLARDTRGAVPKLTLYGPEMAAVGDVSGSEGIASIELQYRPTAADRVAYAFADGSLRRFSWSATGATLSAPIHTFADAQAHSISDPDTFFFVDGAKVYRIIGSGSPEVMATLDSTRGEVGAHHKTPSSLILWQSGNATTDFKSSLFSLSKTGTATPLPLATLPGAFVVGTMGEDVVYKYTVPAVAGGTPESVGIKRIRADGQNDALIADKAISFPRTIFPATLSLNGDELGGIVWCERPTGESDCRNGSMFQYTLSSASTIRLGRFLHNSTYASWDPLEDRDVSPAFSVTSPLVFVSTGRQANNLNTENEMYVARPGVSDSLVRVTAP